MKIEQLVLPLAIVVAAFILKPMSQKATNLKQKDVTAL